VIQPEPDGGCVVAGLSSPPAGGSLDFWAVKMKFLFYADRITMALAILLIMSFSASALAGYIDNPFDCNDQR
jgi:hypothetical protein